MTRRFDRVKETFQASPPTDAFSIDAGYELAKFMKSRLSATVTSDEKICAGYDATECALRHLPRQVGGTKSFVIILLSRLMKK